MPPPTRQRDLGSAPPQPRALARRYQATVAGVVYAGITIMLVLGATNGQNNLLYWAFGLSVAGILLSGVLSGAALMGVRVERLPIEPTRAGQPLTIRYLVRNTNRLVPAYSLTIVERAWHRRFRGRSHASTWPGAIHARAAFVPLLRAGEDVVVEVPCPTRLAGAPTLDLVRLSSAFPLGLANKHVLFSQPARALVRPWRAPVELDTLRGAVRSASSSRRHAPARRPTREPEGELFSLREYAPGDPPRLIAWKATSRFGRLLVRQGGLERSPRVVIHLPLHPGADELEHQRALSLASGLAHALVERLDPPCEVALRVGDADLVPPGASPATVERIDAALVDPAPQRVESPGVERGVRLAIGPAGADPLDARWVHPRAWDQAPYARVDLDEDDQSLPWRRRAWSVLRVFLGLDARAHAEEPP